MPATVQAVLAARIDRLAEREKRVLQTAAVIGKGVHASRCCDASRSCPRSSSPRARRAHERAEFIYEQALYPVAEYAFKHPLTQEVALARSSESAGAHARGGGAGDRRADAEQLDERAALLAHHWEEAGDALEAARWHRRARRGRKTPTPRNRSDAGTRCASCSPAAVIGRRRRRCASQACRGSSASLAGRGRGRRRYLRRGQGARRTSRRSAIARDPAQPVREREGHGWRSARVPRACLQSAASGRAGE